ncbi:hypothetical protein ACFX13_016853 [Malus domestica]
MGGSPVPQHSHPRISYTPRGSPPLAGAMQPKSSIGPARLSQQSPQSPCLKEIKRRRHVSAGERHDDEESVVRIR